MQVTGSAPFADGRLLTLIFEATALCTSPDALTPLRFTASAASNAYAPVYTFDGEVYVIPNDRRGDCNSDDDVDAADFMAEVEEIFDDADSGGVDNGYWLLTPRFAFNGSPSGCDANSDTRIEVADILCTVNVVFDDSACTIPIRQTVAVAAPAALTVKAETADDDTLLVTVNLAANGNAAAGAAFSLIFDPTQLVIDPADANQDGLPDVVSMSAPTDYLSIAQVSFVGDQVDFALIDQTSPLTPLADGTLATVRFQRLDGSAPRLTLLNASLGSTAASRVPVEVDYASDFGRSFTVLLPTVSR